jgi:hypothetical protein
MYLSRLMARPRDTMKGVGYGNSIKHESKEERENRGYREGEKGKMEEKRETTSR